MFDAPVPVYQYYIDPEMPFIWTRFSGQLTDDTLIGFMEHIASQPEWFAGVNELADFREAHGAKLSPKAIRRVADMSMSREQECKIAVLAFGRLNLGLMRMFLSYADGSKEDVRVFQETAEACEFLGIDQYYPPEDWITYQPEKATS